MQDEHPPAGQGQRKLCLCPATACDPAFRSRHFYSKVSLLSGSHEQNIMFATRMSCPTTNFAKGPRFKLNSSPVMKNIGFATTMTPRLSRVFVFTESTTDVLPNNQATNQREI